MKSYMVAPLLSICIPTYNRKNKLTRTLDRLIPQCSGQNVEIVVSDNASNDGTAEYCTHLASSNECFRFFCQEKNKGFSSNLISVLGKAEGEYVWMLGDDELIHQEAVSQLLATIQVTEPAWLVCNFVKLETVNDNWPAAGQISYDGALHPLSLNEILNIVGIWASFMSISIIRKDAFHEWLKCNNKASSDYIGFDIALFSGRKGKCFILPSPILARTKEPLNKHRFDKLSVYLFDFFDPIDSLVKQGVVTAKVRMSLAHEMFFSMAGFLLLKAKIRGGDLPKVSAFVRYHSKIPMFWIMLLPLLIFPSWVVKYGIGLLACFVPKKPESKLNRLIISLRN